MRRVAHEWEFVSVGARGWCLGASHVITRAGFIPRTLSFGTLSVYNYRVRLPRALVRLDGVYVRFCLCTEDAWQCARSTRPQRGRCAARKAAQNLSRHERSRRWGSRRSDDLFIGEGSSDGRETLSWFFRWRDYHNTAVRDSLRIGVWDVAVSSIVSIILYSCWKKKKSYA